MESAGAPIKQSDRLDALRFLAATLVVAFHACAGSIVETTNIFTLWLKNGTSGVTLFLVLSGYLFARIGLLTDKKIIYWRFLLNRILRIMPLLVFVMLLGASLYYEDLKADFWFSLIFLSFDFGNVLHVPCTDRCGPSRWNSSSI